jgi:hypothetical protein
MTLNPLGNLGIGVGNAEGALEVARTGEHTEVFATSYDGEPAFLTRTARGTPAAPTAVQAGDGLGFFAAGGYGATGFSSERAGMGAIAAENWTDDAQGALLVFGTTPMGAGVAGITMVIMPDGNVGIGTPLPPGVLPTVTDKLEVFGDVRVGNADTNGCLKNFAGTGMAGTCASDVRLKRDITPFGSVLGQLTALQPVHYFWRASEFPERRFGDGRAYGLIAQDVEQALPELVVTNADGFKAVDYTKLPLLTVQAVKELKAENEALKERLAGLERLVTEMLAAADRR